jgi:hypothetical protein
MSQRDLHSIVSHLLAIGPASLNADNTPTAQDLANFQSALVTIAVGVGGITFDATNKIEFKMLHGDTTTYAQATAVAQADVRGVTVGAGGIVRSLVAAHAAATVTKVGYFGGKRYLFVLADFSGTHGTATPVCVTIERGHPLLGPAA